VRPSDIGSSRLPTNTPQDVKSLPRGPRTSNRIGTYVLFDAAKERASGSLAQEDANRSPMEISQLKTLMHVAELGSLSRAAERLHIAQPALSRQIRLLEGELGTALFERHGRGMVITAAGREVLARAERILAEIEDIRTLAGSGEADFRGIVSIGVTPTVAEIVTVPLVRHIKEIHPELGLRFGSAFSGHLLDWVQRGELELAVSYDPDPLPTLRTVPVLMEKLLLVSAERGRLDLSRPVPFAQLAGEQLILPSPRHGLRRIVEDCAGRAGVRLRTSLEADSFGAMIDLVRNGFGSTVLPLAPIYRLVEEGSFSAAPIIDPTPTRRVVIAYPLDRKLSPAARFVAQAFRDVAADLVKRNVWVGEIL
jgi:LysR family transcriptional regulator, nitrogen assimilation regulatory protein